MGIYLLIAVSLSLLAIISFYDVALQMAALIHAGDMTQGVLQVLHALLLTIIIVEILETVTAYFRTSRVQVTPILIAGIT
ncbi:phosphate-starvation-inducible PsiE family protein, partial [Methanoculleus sp. UBA413]